MYIQFPCTQILYTSDPEVSYMCVVPKVGQCCTVATGVTKTMVASRENMPHQLSMFNRAPSYDAFSPCVAS